MAAKQRSFFFYLFSATSLFLLQAISAVDSSNRNYNATNFIRKSCGATLYPELCYTSLSRYASAVQQSPGQLARMAVSVSLSKTRQMASYVSTLSHQADFGAEPRAIAALHDCYSTFDDAVDQIRRSLKEMSQLSNTGGSSSFRFHMDNVQTWMSAALTNEDTCTDEFDDVPAGPMKSDVCDRVANVKMFTSNALALLNSFVAQVGANSRSTP